MCCRRSVDSQQGSEVFSSGSGDIDVIGVNGDVVMERGKEEGVEYFLSYTGGGRRHGRWGRMIETASL
jgi:hypothetical protein